MQKFFILCKEILWVCNANGVFVWRARVSVFFAIHSLNNRNFLLFIFSFVGVCCVYAGVCAAVHSQSTIHIYELADGIYAAWIHVIVNIYKYKK